MKYNIYTDGSCRGNGKTNNQGGYAFVIYKENSESIYGYGCGYSEDTTNNKMELQAIVSALIYVTKTEPDSFFTIYSDSAYVINAINEGWLTKWKQNGWHTSTKQSVKNKELWEQILPYINNFYFTFKKVKGHDTDAGNLMADALATAAADGKIFKEGELCEQNN